MNEAGCELECQERNEKIEYLKKRLQGLISLENRVSQLLLWRKYLEFLDSVETFVQIKSVNFKVPLHAQYIEAKEINVNIEASLAFTTTPLRMQTTADILASRDLLTSTMASKIVEQIAILLGVE